jgi:hypothetical protein
MKQFLIAGLLVAIGVVALAGAPVHAQSKYCNYHRNNPDCFNQGSIGYDQGPRPAYQPVSRCAFLGQNLKRFGYRYVRPLDCSGSSYKFEVFRGYQRFILKVRASDGRIIYAIRG